MDSAPARGTRRLYQGAVRSAHERRRRVAPPVGDRAPVIRHPQITEYRMPPGVHGEAAIDLEPTLPDRATLVTGPYIGGPYAPPLAPPPAVRRWCNHWNGSISRPTRVAAWGLSNISYRFICTRIWAPGKPLAGCDRGNPLPSPVARSGRAAGPENRSPTPYCRRSRPVRRSWLDRRSEGPLWLQLLRTLRRSTLKRRWRPDRRSSPFQAGAEAGAKEREWDLPKKKSRNT